MSYMLKPLRYYCLAKITN